MTARPTISAPAPEQRFPETVLVLLGLAVALAPLLFLVTLLVGNYYSVPYYDSWSFYYRLAEFMGGKSSWGEFLFSQQNEARPAVPRLLLFLLHSATRDLAAAVILNVVTAVATAGTVLALLRKTNANLSWLVLLTAFFFLNLNFFSIAQWQNWNWRNQILMLLPNLFLALGWLINLSSLRPLLRGALVSLSCALATFCFANGMFQWLLVFPIAFGLSRPEKMRLWGLHSGAAVICLVIYFAGYTAPREHDASFALSHPEAAGSYFFAWLGSSLSAGSARLAQVWGVVLFLIFLSLVFQCFRNWRRHRFEIEWLPWLAFGCYALISAGLTSVARSHIGLEQALRPRYCTISLWLFVGIIGLGVTLLRQQWERTRGSVRPGFALVAMLATAFLVFHVRHATHAAEQWSALAEKMRFQKQALGLEAKEPGQLWSFDHPNRALVLASYALMRQTGFLRDALHSENILPLIKARKTGRWNDGEMEIAACLPFREIRCRGWSVGGDAGAGNRVLIALLMPGNKVLLVGDGPINRARPDVLKHKTTSSPSLAGFDLEFQVPKLGPGSYRLAAFRYGKDERFYHPIGAPKAFEIPPGNPSARRAD